VVPSGRDRWLEQETFDDLPRVSAGEPAGDLLVKTYRLRDVRYWFDRETRVWWAARYDADGNQIGNAVHAATRDGIRREIDACFPKNSEKTSKSP
jgi:hypothetical protein